MLATLAAAALAVAPCGSAERAYVAHTRSGTAVVACHRGRRRVVHRGEHVWAAGAAGGRVAWIQRRGERVRVAVYSLRRSRIVRRIRARTDLDSHRFAVAITPRGTLAWSEYRGLTGRVVVKGSRRPRRVLHRTTGELGGFAIEDGRTLRFRDESEMKYADLVPFGPGCPRRERFRTVLRTPDVLVTRADYSDGFEAEGGTGVIRGCLRASGYDPVVAYDHSSSVGGSYTFPVAARPPFLVLSFQTSFKGMPDEPGSQTVTSVDLRTGAPVRVATATAEDGVPGQPDEVVLTSSGIPAWIVDDGSRLAAAGADRRIFRIDESAPGGLRGLTADGDTIRWTHDGAPRSTVLR